MHANVKPASYQSLGIVGHIQTRGTKRGQILVVGEQSHLVALDEVFDSRGRGDEMMQVHD